MNIKIMKIDQDKDPDYFYRLTHTKTQIQLIRYINKGDDRFNSRVFFLLKENGDFIYHKGKDRKDNNNNKKKQKSKEKKNNNTYK